MRSNGSTRNLQIVAIPLLAWALLASCSPGAQQDPPPTASDAVAEVNGVPIPRERLEEVVTAELARLQARGEAPSEEVERNLRREAMRLVISGELCYQAARAAGIEIPEERIEKQLEGARSQFASEEEFRENLAESGLDPAQLERDTERRLLISAYVSSVTQETQFDVDSSEARRIFDEQRDQFREPDQIRVSQIVVRFLPYDPPNKKAAARAKIDKAWARLQTGADFAQVAREFSESPMAKDGGDLGYFSRGRTLPEFEDKVFATPMGKMTGIFETSHGYNIAKVVDFKPGRSLAFEEARTGLMMVLAREQRDEALSEQVRQLWDAAEIKFLDPDLEPSPREESF